LQKGRPGDFYDDVQGGNGGARAGGALAATGADAKWLRADTDNFIIYSERSEKSLREFAENLQRFDATLRFRFKIPGARSLTG
jgi:hypothetical protein